MWTARLGPDVVASDFPRGRGGGGGGRRGRGSASAAPPAEEAADEFDQAAFDAFQAELEAFEAAEVEGGPEEEGGGGEEDAEGSGLEEDAEEGGREDEEGSGGGEEVAAPAKQRLHAGDFGDPHYFPLEGLDFKKWLELFFEDEKVQISKINREIIDGVICPYAIIDCRSHISEASGAWCRYQWRCSVEN